MAVSTQSTGDPMCEEEGWLRAWRDMGVRSDLVPGRERPSPAPGQVCRPGGHLAVWGLQPRGGLDGPSSPQDHAAVGVFVSPTLAGAKMSHEDSMRPLRKTQDLREPRRP